MLLDNPINDIALVSVLRGPIYSFTDNELLEIKLNDRDKSFYQSLLNASNNKLSENLLEKVENFLLDIKEFRKNSKYISISELIWKYIIKLDFSIMYY